MGPAGHISAVNTGNLNNAPKFVTNVTSKVPYRDSLRRWIKMISKFVKVEKKWHANLEGAGDVIYMSCDETAQDMFKKVESSGIFSLDFTL